MKNESVNEQKENKRKIKGFLPIFVFIFIFVAGLGIMVYPTISNMINQRSQSNAINNYDKIISEASKEELDAEWKKAYEYNENLAGDPVHDPFVLGSGYALPENYLDVLNIGGDGIMGYIQIPEIDVKLSIYHGTNDDVLSVGIGHIESTALPIGGEFTHSVLTGHSGLSGATLFTNLTKLKLGDKFYVTVLDKTIAYEVDSIQVILPEDLSNLRAEKGKDYLTLVTCTPYAVNSHRLLVRGVRTEYSGDATEIEKISEEHSWLEKLSVTDIALIIGLSVAALLIIIILIFFVFIPRKKKRKNEKADSKIKEGGKNE